ncbi:PTS lactose/cellobiose transporter subunit IIA [Anoxybacillus flavithermus]
MDATSEETVFQIILHGGNGKSLAMEAIQLAKKGDIQAAKDKIKEAEQSINEAHHVQTALIQNEVSGNKNEVSLLMVHAQDHLMTAITIKDLAAEMIDLYDLLNKKGVTLP